MAKFKTVPQTFLFRKMLEFWGNLVRNYDGDCRDEDFFDVVRNCFDHGKALELIGDAYTTKELEAMQTARARNDRLDFNDSLDEIFRVIWNFKAGRERCRIVLDSIRGYLEAECGRASDDPLEKRFRELRRILKLSELETEIAMVAYVFDETCLDWPCRVEDREKPLYYAMALDRSYAEVSKALSAKGRLRKFEVLDDDWDFNSRTLGNYMDGTENEAIERRFYKKIDLRGSLPLAFYGDLATQDGVIIQRLLSASRGRCNILLYGAPGTGKTSFARTLCQSVGRRAYEVRQGEEDGNNMKAEARMVGIQIANEQEESAESVLIVDEADELLRGSSCGFGLFGIDLGGRTEKGVTNSILDDMRIPAIWISNAPAEAMDASVRRRFAYSVCFEELNATQRVSIWRNLVKKYGMSGLISETRIEDYAIKYETSAGGIALVLESIRQMSPGKDEVDGLIENLMKPHCKLMGVKEGGRLLLAKDYSLEGLNIKGNIGLEKIESSVRNYLNAGFNVASVDKPRMNLLLFGPPGTGKTEFVKYLGKTLDRKVLVKKTSDILDMYVGNTEKKIAEAFRQAEVEHAILFFDEIDGLVQDREGASQSWQVTQVNELLQQMENFGGVMIAATNLRKNLDPAIMRRFTFKLEFDYLDDGGKKLFFERMFKTVLMPEEYAELRQLANLAPGDFRTVRQEQFYLDVQPTNSERIAALRAECALKKGGKRPARIGFGA